MPGINLESSEKELRKLVDLMGIMEACQCSGDKGPFRELSKGKR